MRALLVPVLVFCFALPAAHATPRQDAQAIVEMTVNEEILGAAFDVMNDLSVDSFQNQAAKAGKLLSDDAARVMAKMMFAEMIPMMVAAMREEMSEAYIHSMSPQALADLRTFLESPSGIEWAKAQPTLTRETTKVAEKVVGPIAAEAGVRMNQAVAADDWPAGTLLSTREEIRTFLSDN